MVERDPRFPPPAVMRRPVREWPAAGYDPHALLGVPMPGPCVGCASTLTLLGPGACGSPLCRSLHRSEEHAATCPVMAHHGRAKLWRWN